MKKNIIKQTIVLATVLIGVSQPALGLVTQGSSSAYGISAGTTITDQNPLVGVTANLTLAPTPTASGIAPAPYNVNNSLLSLAATNTSGLGSLGGGSISLSSGVLNVSASSNVDGLPGIRNAQASSSVANFNSSIGLIGTTSLLNTVNFFNVAGMTLTSSASVTGDFGSFTTAGSSTIIDANGAGDGFATFNVLGVNFNIAVDSFGNAAPNTTLTINSASSALFADAFGTDLTGSLTIILNEQIITGDGITSRGIEVNALHVIFNNAGAEFFNALGVNIDDSSLINGGYIVGHSQAALQAVPEPSTVCLLALGGCLAFLRIRSPFKG